MLIDRAKTVFIKHFKLFQAPYCIIIPPYTIKVTVQFYWSKAKGTGWDIVQVHWCLGQSELSPMDGSSPVLGIATLITSISLGIGYICIHLIDTVDNFVLKQIITWSNEYGNTNNNDLNF